MRLLCSLLLPAPGFAVVADILPPLAVGRPELMSIVSGSLASLSSPVPPRAWVEPCRVESTGEEQDK